jgi:hypothetical protein
MRIDGELIYTLVDTPGFQRARRAWSWLKDRETTAAEHRKTVEAFVAAHRGSDAFPDECELLEPVLGGAGVLYVVDGSLPYGPEYEAEMEVLRWTGQPSLALINCIGDEDHIDEWKAALRQYFHVVRVFDALKAPFDARIELLRAFGQLEEGWSKPLGVAVESLETERSAQYARAARAIAESMADMLTTSTTRHLAADDDPGRYHDELERQLRQKLRNRERRSREVIESIYDHHTIERSDADIELLDRDLFSTDDWYFWGLNRRQLVTASATGGAVVGGVLDVAAGGASLLLGGLVGAVIGGASALFGGARLTKLRILTLPLGGVLLRCGPPQHENFPYVVLGRALHHRWTIAGRTHANRTALDLAAADGDHRVLSGIDSSQRQRLEGIFRRLRSGSAPHEVSEQLGHSILEILLAD